MDADLPQGWEMNMSGGQPYYVEYERLSFFSAKMF